MDNFKYIYKILKTLEKAMDIESFDFSSINYENLELSKPRRSSIVKMLVDSGYISGVDVWNSFDCEYAKITLVRPEITLKGLEYLNENTIMRKMYNLAKGVSTLIP